MAIKPKIIIILMIFTIIFFFSCISSANAITHTNYKEPIRINCGDGVYINFDTSTFDKAVEITCARNDKLESFDNIGQIISPIYEIKVTGLDDNNEYNFFRKEATINFPKNILLDQSNISGDATIFFYDNIINDWISYNTSDIGEHLQAKLMHMGNFAVFNKVYESTYDIYKTLATYLILLGIGVSVIYVIIKKYI